MNPNTTSLSQPHPCLAFTNYAYPSLRTSHSDMSRTSFGKIVASPALLDWTPRGSNEPQHPLFISATSFLSLFHLRVSFIPNIPSWHVPDRFRVHSGIPTLFGLDPEGMKCTPTPPQPHFCLAFTTYEHPTLRTSHPDMSLTGFGYIVVSPRSSVWTPRGWNALQHPLSHIFA